MSREVNKFLDLANIVAEKAMVYDTLRHSEAQEYCNKYIMVDAWGKITWNAILDDAIKLRERIKELETENNNLICEIKEAGERD